MLNEIYDQKSTVLKYFLIAPCLIILISIFSFVQKGTETQNKIIDQKSASLIGELEWEGNTLYSDEFLTKHLGLKKGDGFDEKAINEKLYKNVDGKDLVSLFMDRGYFYFNVEMKKQIKEGQVDLTFKLYEGDVITFNEIIVNGNYKISNEEILKMINIEAGDLFSRTKLIAAQNNITASGFFNPENIEISPIVNPSEGKVDLEFTVVEL